MAYKKQGKDSRKPSFGQMVREPAPAWQTSVGTYLTGQAEVDETDLLAIEMERKWGADRLRLLVEPALREKFDRQRYLYNQALWNGELADVIREAKRMRAAWSALDRVATGLGKAEKPATVWEVVLEDGSVAAVVEAPRDAERVIAEGRGLAVYTMQEIGVLLSKFPEVVKAKNAFPGAKVYMSRKHVNDPLDAVPNSSVPIDGILEDDLPF